MRAPTAEEHAALDLLDGWFNVGGAGALAHPVYELRTVFVLSESALTPTQCAALSDMDDLGWTTTTWRAFVLGHGEWDIS